jgi:aconitate hydratase
VGQRWRIPGLAAAVDAAAGPMTAEVEGVGAVPVVLDVSPGERQTLRAGGLLAQVRAGGRARLAAP